MGKVYYFPAHPYNTISLGALTVYVGSKKVTSELIEHCDFVDPQGFSWISPYHTQKNVDHLQIEIVKFNPQINRNIVVPTVCDLSKQNLSQIIHQRFGHVSIYRLIRMSRKGPMEGHPTTPP